MGKVVAFGEIMQRLTPQGNERMVSARAMDVCYGGTESNVLVALSSLGVKTSYLTVLPKNVLGEAVLRHLRSYGVGTQDILMRGDVLGSYYMDFGYGNLPNSVIYNRKYSEITGAAIGDFDYDTVFEDCDLFHISGISFALSDSSKDLAFALIQEAGKRKIPVSFDCNYRGKLWDKETAGKMFRSILPFVDILLCSPQDFDDFFHIAIEDFYKHYSCEYLVLRKRDSSNPNLQGATVTIFHKTKEGMETKTETIGNIPVLEKIGTGDAFDAGVIYAWLQNRNDIQAMIDTGLLMFELKHMIHGDVISLTKEEIDGYRNGKKGGVGR